MRYACLLGLLLPLAAFAAAREVTFAQSAETVEAYDFVEVAANIAAPDVDNPFTGATIRGSFGKTGETARVAVEGFCDSADGSVFRIRFTPASPGDYTYSISYQQGGFEKTHSGSFRATDGHRRGPVRVDAKYPWHFVWEGTGEHYFFNGTTAFWLMGWQEDHVIDFSIERLARMKINRIRVLLAGAANIYWGEPVMTGKNFSMMLRPWLAKKPESFDNPGIDFTRFNIPYWHRWERMLRFARDRDVIISAILDISTHEAQAAAGSEDERRYVHYAVARLSAFSNVTWDLGDDLDSFRDEVWAHETGTLIETWDPYHHLATSHPVHREHQDRASAWFGFTSIQEWSRDQHNLMLEERQIQLKTGRIIPQANEEYGYEDHYPHWAPGLEFRNSRHAAPHGVGHRHGRSLRDGGRDLPGGHQYLARHRRRLDQRTRRRHDDHAQGLRAHRRFLHQLRVVEDSSRTTSWSTAETTAWPSPARFTPLISRKAGKVTIQLEPGEYDAKWFSAFTGEWIPLPPVKGPSWTSPEAPAWLDSALLVQKKP